MATSCIEERAMISTRTGSAAIALLACLGLGACAQSSMRINPDFGRAVRQDVAAQIANPDAKYEGTPDPGARGDRVGLAQKRYQNNQVIQPSTTTASGSSSIGQADNGAGGGIGASTGVAASQ
jgi:hypothetical protein